MPSYQGQAFKIESYHVSHGRNRGPTAGSTVSLYLYGTLAGGDDTPREVYLEFSPTHTGLSGQYQDPQVTVVLPYEDFSALYDLLRHEAPVYATYSWDPETSELNHFRLNTNAFEPPGEGLADADSPRANQQPRRDGSSPV